ncbi:hypothetical protein OJ997_02775 [Solirubrobacter phytolaccae]|uniref:Gram-positive cocci surface proteins LPxTG domain-containing protein n=1 Tax=Solirubrobacter phytolaccae TaxID=1404360 RepID=A0A9X3SCY4_9ACTN|nr:hypothetical protein [Solirubrobacter phytolaccae]MDA0179207.1 hypothetical protein [Solirubrobacter phytolaccae]
MTRRIALITTLLVLAVAAPASAQSGAFGPLPQAEPTATPAPTTTVDTGETGSRTLWIILGALVVGFGVMGVLITRDARSKAPEIATAGPVVPEGTGARKPHTQAAKKKMRQKTRAQKQARKAHRR